MILFHRFPPELPFLLISVPRGNPARSSGSDNPPFLPRAPSCSARLDAGRGRGSRDATDPRACRCVFPRNPPTMMVLGAPLASCRGDLIGRIRRGIQLFRQKTERCSLEARLAGCFDA